MWRNAWKAGSLKWRGNILRYMLQIEQRRKIQRNGQETWNILIAVTLSKHGLQWRCHCHPLWNFLYYYTRGGNGVIKVGLKFEHFSFSLSFFSPNVIIYVNNKIFMNKTATDCVFSDAVLFFFCLLLPRSKDPNASCNIIVPLYYIYSFLLF